MALAQALSSGMMPQLECLDLSYSDKLGGDLVVAIINTLSSPACPRLRVLDMAGMNVGSQSTQAIRQALEEGRLPCLEELRLTENRDLEEAEATALVEALKGDNVRKNIVGLGWFAHDRGPNESIGRRHQRPHVATS